MDRGQQPDTDGDGIGDACDLCPLDKDNTMCRKPDANDEDGDGISNNIDNCSTVSNADQKTATWTARAIFAMPSELQKSRRRAVNFQSKTCAIRPRSASSRRYQSHGEDLLIVGLQHQELRFPCPRRRHRPALFRNPGSQRRHRGPEGHRRHAAAKLATSSASPATSPSLANKTIDTITNVVITGMDLTAAGVFRRCHHPRSARRTADHGERFENLLVRVKTSPPAMRPDQPR